MAAEERESESPAGAESEMTKIREEMEKRYGQGKEGP